MIDPVYISLRAAAEYDEDFCYEVKKAAIGPYVADTWGWNEDFQREFHRTDWEIRRPSIIVHQGSDIGTIETGIEDDHYQLGEFYLLPEYQSQGIGTHLLHRLIIQADVNSAFIKLRVLRANPARKLYERHGFKIYDQTRTHFLMQREPLPHGATVFSGRD